MLSPGSHVVVFGLLFQILILPFHYLTDLKTPLCALQLQDLAVSPGLRDPRLNNAECVIEGHKPDIKATGRSHYIRAILWCSGWFVLVASPCFLP